MQRLKSLSVVYLGNLVEGSTSLHRFQALSEVAGSVTPVQYSDEFVRRSSPAYLWARVLQRLYRTGFDVRPTPDILNLNSQLLNVVSLHRPNIVWLDKALTIKPATFAEIRQLAPHAIIVGYSPDDMSLRFNRTVSFDRTLPLYDIFFTTKSYNVAELETAGCPCVIFVGNGFDPATHRPVTLTDEQRKAFGGPVGFIGTYERERAQELEALADAGIGVRIWGTGWPPGTHRKAGMKVEGRAIYGDDYANALNAFDINLAFLCKRNRDLQTTRSVEIPACGAFMLAERTDEHLQLFEEGKEAEFFGSRDEMIDKCRFYLANPEERKRIASAGRERCLRSGYSNIDRVRFMLDQAISTGQSK